jgi:hypothetical protein
MRCPDPIEKGQWLVRPRYRRHYVHAWHHPEQADEAELLDAAWTIVKDGKWLKEHGHYSLYRWAREVVGIGND